MSGALSPEQRLRANALGLPQIIASTMANIAPAMSIFFGFGVIAEGAGVAAPITIIMAMVVILFLANTVAEFTRYRPSAGSFVTFIGVAFGPAAAATASIFVVFGYLVAASSVVIISGGWVQDALNLFLGLNIPWQLLSTVFAIVVGVLVSRGIGISTRWAAIFFYFELALLVVGAVIMLWTHRGNLTLTPLNPGNLANGLSGLGLGFPLAVYLFIGWENSAMLAEETKEPRKNIPRALIASTITIGILYIFLSYAIEVGFNYDAAAIAKSDVPYIDALKASAAGLLIVAYLAGIVSILSSLIGLTNSQARILFNSAREGLLPKFFSRVHEQHRTPHVAMWTFLAFTLLIVFVFGWGTKPVDLFGYTGTLGTIPVIVTYLATNLALPVYMRRERPRDYRTFRHLVLPLLGVLLMLLPIWGLVKPGQDAPFNWFPLITLCVFLVAGIYGLLLARRRPNLVGQIGSFIADGAEAHPAE